MKLTLQVPPGGALHVASLVRCGLDPENCGMDPEAVALHRGDGEQCSADLVRADCPIPHDDFRHIDLLSQQLPDALDRYLFLRSRVRART